MGVIALSNIGADECHIVLPDMDAIRLSDIGSIVMPGIDADEGHIVLLDIDGIRLSDIGVTVVRDIRVSFVPDAGNTSVLEAGAAAARSTGQSSRNMATTMAARIET